MTATNIFVGLLVGVFTIRLLYGMRKVRPQYRLWNTTDVPVLRIDHFSIEASCLECGKSFTEARTRL